MKALISLVSALLVMALIIGSVGCGGNGEEIATPVQTATVGGATATPETTPQAYTGESFKFRVSHQSIIGDIEDQRWNYINERLQYYTDGKCKLEIYPASSLYRGLEEWDACATGALDMMTVSSWQPTMQGLMDWQLPFMGFFWGEKAGEGRAHWERFAYNPDGGGVLLKQLEDHGIKGIGFYSTGGITMNVNKKKRVVQLRDMKGWKNMSVGGFSEILVQACGLTPVFIDPAEQQIAFEQGLIDSINIGPDRVLTTKLYETAPYGLCSDPVASTGCTAMNLNKWNSLPSELQDIWINKILPDVRQWSIDNDLPFYMQCLEELKSVGFTVDFIPKEERDWLRDEMWRLGCERGYIPQINEELLKLADHLRVEPYTTGRFYSEPPGSGNYGCPE